MELDEVVARAEIAALHTTYIYYVDNKRAADFAGLFAPDGALESFTGRCIAGRAEITDYITRLMATRTEGTWVGIRHHICPAYVEFTGPDSATAVTYFEAYNDTSIDHWGVYSDVLTRIDGAWRFASRRCDIEGRVEGGWVATGSAASTSA
jgi:uncharacterized protein (TIGR02246 family)